VDVVYADANLIDEGERIIGRYYTEQWNARRLLHRPFICQPAAFFRRRVVDRFGLLDATLHYSMDYEYWLRLARGGASFAYFPFTVASSRVHALTKTVTAGTDIHDELNVMLKRYVRCIPDEWILTQTHAVLRTRKFSNPASFALAVAQESLRLSLRLNGGVSRRLALRTLRTLSAGAVKTGLRAPLTRPLQ
jgi:hypothetical protein